MNKTDMKVKEYLERANRIIEKTNDEDVRFIFGDESTVLIAKMIQLQELNNNTDKILEYVSCDKKKNIDLNNMFSKGTDSL